MHDEAEFRAFLLRAKRATYAGKGPERAASRPQSHDLYYAEGAYAYLDTYLGGERFSGEEAVWKDGTPIWAMNYSGRVSGAGFSGDFLKEALLHATEQLPYRGPAVFSDGDDHYEMEVEGDLDWFCGTERIFHAGAPVYACYFHGGEVR